MRVLSGIQPSGNLHIGNYFGMMKPMIDHQDRDETFVFIVNYHALTSVTDPDSLKEGTLDAALDFLSLGIDPEKSVFWIQSDLPEVTELTWILSTVTPLGLLERCHSYKDKVARGITASHGLFAYPVLMAADILLFQAERVPVGKDQKQHLEVARDIALRFNHVYGHTFTLPEPEIDLDLSVIPGIDGNKMSKSYDNTLEIFSDYETLKKKIMGIVTDSTPVNQPKNPDTCNLFAIYRPFASSSEIEQLRDRYTSPGLKYSDVKKELLSRVWEYFEPFRKRRQELNENLDSVHQIMKRGADKARSIAASTLETVRRRTGLAYR